MNLQELDLKTNFTRLGFWGWMVVDLNDPFGDLGLGGVVVKPLPLGGEAFPYKSFRTMCLCVHACANTQYEFSNVQIYECTNM